MYDWKLVWFAVAIPKQAFIVWLAARDSLITGERLLKWGFKGDVLCAFCRGGIEGRNHLFFECGFCRRVWMVNLRKCLISDLLYEWDAIVLSGVECWNGKGL